MYLRYVFEARNFSPDIVVFNVYTNDIARYFPTCIIEKPNLTIEDGKIKIGPRKYLTVEDFYYSYNSSKFESYFVKGMIYRLNTVIYGDKYYMKEGLKQFSAILDDVKEKTREYEDELDKADEIRRRAGSS